LRLPGSADIPFKTPVGVYLPTLICGYIPYRNDFSPTSTKHVPLSHVAQQ
jgi:hypothetical protein